MTAQWADNLTNKHPCVSFGDFRCYGLTRRKPAECLGWDGVLGDLFDFPRPPIPPMRGCCTGCYRGYIANLVLNADGTLALASFDYFRPTDANPIHFDNDPVGEKITGEFWLMLRPDFYTDPTIFVPFRDGQIIADQSQWVAQLDNAG